MSKLQELRAVARQKGLDAALIAAVRWGAETTADRLEEFYNGSPDDQQGTPENRQETGKTMADNNQ